VAPAVPAGRSAAAGRSPRRPRPTPPSLAGLEERDPDDVDWDAGLDGVRVAGADLSGRRLVGVTWQESELVDLRADGARWEGCRLLDVRLDRLDAPELLVPESTWRDSEVLGSRVGALGLHGAKVTSVRVAGSKIDYLNLRGAEVTDLVLADCAIGELDLADARLARVSLEGCAIGTLDVRGASLLDVDLRGARLDAVDTPAGLRGATVTHAQLLDLAPALAREAGLLVD